MRSSPKPPRSRLLERSSLSISVELNYKNAAITETFKLAEAWKYIYLLAMSSPPRSNMGRSKSPLASDKAFGKKNITPSKHKLELTTNRVARQANSPGSRQPKSPERSGTPNRNLSSIPTSVLNASGKAGRPAENSPMRAVRVIDHSDSEALIDKLIKNREQLCSYL